jgi:hypothetical protein
MSLYDYSQLDLTLVRGVPFAAVFRLLDAEGNPVDLDAHEIYAAVHTTDEHDGAVLATFAVEVIDDEAGDVVFRLSQDTTAGFASSRFAGWFYSWYSGPSTNGERRPLWHGLVSVR